MKIKIIDVELSSATDKKGKPYQIVEVSYKNLTFNKVESRKIMPFGATADTNKLLAKAQAGEFYEVEVVKNTAGFNDWVSAKLTDEATPDSAPQASPARKMESPTSAASSGYATQPVKSTYETPEERAKKQIYIVRQSSITSAMSFFELNKAKSVSTQQVLEVAKEFENYVFGISLPKDSGPVTSFEDMEDDIPL